MRLLRLYLRNFRSYAETKITFGPKVNAFYGANAQGKTNLLEAIYLLSTGKSFRTVHLKELIREGETFFYLEAHFLKDGIEQALKISFNGTARKLEYNQTAYSSFSSLFGILPSTLFSPEDFLLISGAPEGRRRFFDLHLSQLDPLYVHHLGRYFQALKQRNYLLRSKSLNSIEAFEKTMAASASYLTNKRQQMLEELEPFAVHILQEISQSSDRLSLRYMPTLCGTKNYEEAYLINRNREMQLGSTLIGPHRDDLFIEINGKEARIFASEGQKVSAAAALKIAEWFHLKERLGTPPLFGLDDFGVHLDSHRMKKLEELLKNLGQVFLTSPHPSLFFPSEMQVFTISREQGVYRT